MFKWGLEFETNLIYFDEYGNNRQRIWEKDKLKITSEFFDVQLHKPNQSDGKYWLKGVPEDDVTGIFNIEAQLGVFKGFDGFGDFESAIKTLDKKLKSSVKSKTFKDHFRNKKYHLFTSVYSDTKDGLYLDTESKIEGAYESKDGGWVGYQKELNQTNIIGKPQLTASFNLKYIPLLFKILSPYNQEFDTYFADNVMKIWGIKNDELYGFILYLCHYYKRYLEYSNNKDMYHYFKTIFFLKPRTNPATVYNMMTKTQKMHISKLKTKISSYLSKNKDLEELEEYLVYLQNIITFIEHAVEEKDCVYTNDIPNVPNSLYHYDKESFEMAVAFEQQPEYVTKDIPCVDPYEKAGMPIDDPLPTLSYGEDEEFYVSTGFTNVWEWQTKEKGVVAFEFRDVTELFGIALDIDGEYENPGFAHFFGIDMYTPMEVSEMISYILRTIFQKIFKEKSSKKSNSKKAKSPKKSKKSPKGSKKSLKGSKKSLKKCTDDKERSPKTGRCIKTCQPGKKRNPVTGRCKKSI